MGAAIAAQFPWALMHVALIVLVRSLPATLYFAASRRLPLVRRVAVVLIYATLVALLDDLNRSALGWYAVGVGYYGVCSGILFWLTRRAAAIRGLDALLLFVTLALLFMGVPALLLPSSADAFLFLGWELALKGYSYCVEPASRKDDLRTVAFYFLVDPTLVYGQRGQPVYVPGGDQPSLRRFGLGAFAIFLPSLLTTPAGVPTILGEGEFARHPLGGALLYALVPFLATYAKHSGVASLQIALMRTAGYRVPERYRYPLSARTPAEFWERWNTYVGAWLKRYVHMPVGLRFARRASPRIRALGPTASVVAVFLAIGVLHDGFAMLSFSQVSARWTYFFLLNAALMLTWMWIRDGVMTRVLASSGIAHRLASRAAFVAAFFVAVDVWTQMSGNP